MRYSMPSTTGGASASCRRSLPRSRPRIRGRCPAWPVGQAAAEERRAATSDVPILLLSGELDPVTPAAWAKFAAKDLPRAVRLDFRGIGHGVLAAHACAGVIVGRFLADPARSL